jgi:hypothetical protein
MSYDNDMTHTKCQHGPFPEDRNTNYHLWFSILVGAIDSIMESLIIHTGTSPEAIALWATMKNSITVDQIDFNFETPKELRMF